LQQYEKLGAKLVPISLPRTELSIPVYYIIAPAEASSNLSRFDGVKFGHRAKEYTDLADMYKQARAEGFGDEVKRRIMIGAYVLSHGYYDAYYLQAQKIRRMIADDFQERLQGVRRDCRAGGTHRGLEAGRKVRRPGGQLPGRHLHPARLAGRPARHEFAGGLSTVQDKGMPDGPAADRQLFPGSPAARTWRTASSKPPTSTPHAPQDFEHEQAP